MFCPICLMTFNLAHIITIFQNIANVAQHVPFWHRGQYNSEHKQEVQPHLYKVLLKIIVTWGPWAPAWDAASAPSAAVALMDPRRPAWPLRHPQPWLPLPPPTDPSTMDPPRTWASIAMSTVYLPRWPTMMLAMDQPWTTTRSSALPRPPTWPSVWGMHNPRVRLPWPSGQVDPIPPSIFEYAIRFVKSYVAWPVPVVVPARCAPTPLLGW